MSLTLLTLLSAASAETTEPAPTLEGLMAALKETYSDTESLQADFTQVTRSPGFGDGPEQTGRITLGQPRMMRVEFSGDNGSLFVSDGDNLYVWSQLGNQVIITPDLSERSDGVSDLLSSLPALEERFNIAITATTSASIELALTPRDTAQFQTMSMSLSAADYRLTRLSVTDVFDNTTEMTFDNLILNPELPATVFEFETPEGATVIRADNI